VASPVPHLREVLGAAALASGPALAEGPDGALTQDEALQAAERWGLLPTGGAAGAGADSCAPTVVVLVDGLGLDQLRERRGHAPALRGLLAASEAAASAGSGPGPEAVTCRPSTTAAALTALGTGALPGATGMVGYSVRNPLLPPASAGGAPSSEDLISLISWEGRCPDPRAWQDVPTIFERLRLPDGSSAEAPLAITIGPARFAGSGLTEAGLRGAPHIGADAMEQRAGRAAEALRRGVPLVYLYVGELDHAGHAHGWRSEKWLAQLERLDALVAELQRRVPRGTRIMLTADHGMVDTDDEHRLLITDSPGLMRDVVCVAGEPRFTHLYVGGRDDAERAERASAVAERWRAELGERALWVGTRDEAGEHLGPLGERARGVTGDVLVAAAGAWVVLDPRVHTDTVLGMPGVHGSFTGAETRIPLLITRA